MGMRSCQLQKKHLKKPDKSFGYISNIHFGKFENKVIEDFVTAWYYIHVLNALRILNVHRFFLGYEYIC